VIRWNPDGSYTAQFGQVGNGPKEFSPLGMQLFVVPDQSLLVGSMGKWTMLTPDFEYRDEVRSTFAAGSDVLALALPFRRPSHTNFGAASGCHCRWRRNIQTIRLRLMIGSWISSFPRRESSVVLSGFRLAGMTDHQPTRRKASTGRDLTATVGPVPSRSAASVWFATVGSSLLCAAMLTACERSP
jgi:hypothetical protein